MRKTPIEEIQSEQFQVVRVLIDEDEESITDPKLFSKKPKEVDDNH